MKKPVLVIMAAGMGSRYGGLKQIDPIEDKPKAAEAIQALKDKGLYPQSVWEKP